MYISIKTSDEGMKTGMKKESKTVARHWGKRAVKSKKARPRKSGEQSFIARPSISYMEMMFRFRGLEHRD